MLVLSRLYPKGGLDSFWNVLESEKRNLYWDDVKPIYALQQEGKEYISVTLDVKNIGAVNKVFMKNLSTMASVKKTNTIPIMNPLYFPLPEGHPTDMNRYLVFLRVVPEKYDDVYHDLITLDYPRDVIMTFLSVSFGDDDIIVSMLAKDRETAQNFVTEKIGAIEGINAHDCSRVVKNIAMLPKDKVKKHKAMFMYSVPAGQKGQLANRTAYEKYLNERSMMTVIVRLFAKKSLGKLWEDIENHIPKFETKDLVPLYASQQEAKSFINVIFEANNFEVLRDVLVKNIPTLVDVRKSRTIPMVDPTYFLLSKKHPQELERYLISLRVDPIHYQNIRSKILRYKYPGNVFLTYITRTLGEDDILMSILTDSRESAQDFVKTAFDKMEGVSSYNLSNQLKTKRLTSKERWKKHLDKFLSSYDKQHKKEFDGKYDWTDDFYEYAALTGAFIHEFNG